MPPHPTPLHAALLCALLAAGSHAWAQDHAAHGGGHATKEQKPWGIAGDARPGLRTVKIRMLDTMRFTPDRIMVKEGETLRLTVTNAGALKHELVIGTDDELGAHAAMMAQHPTMHHDEPSMAHVLPKKTVSLVWTFNRPGDFAFACLVAGHLQAGMRGTIRVEPAR